ncbi:metalloregulator ArsR/SmtB family transcription factor [Rhodococcus sp. Q]|uniref:ArsR/SmtB family transcription factor n=1 Tax=Rhodococcus sp. Q TaxID=2502252 RepID=UPI0010F95BAE|nr:metalloregulator ArsR/SmtB family transcription factor [Rhodococcus sp. Q]
MSGTRAELYDQIARVGKAVGHGGRLRILDLLAQSERTVDAIATATEMNVTTASANLQALKASGLVVARRDGTRQIYSLAGPDVARLLVLVQDVARAHLAEVAASAAEVLGSPDDAITREELIRRRDAGEITLVDVRPSEEFAAGHIPGSINVPLADLARRLGELPAGREIVAYCRGAYCVMAPDAVRIAREAGMCITRLDGGMLEWRLAGLPVAGS